MILDDRTEGCAIRHCLNLADGYLDSTPLCFSHIELAIERLLAIEECPSLRETLPALEEVWQA